MGYRPLAVLSLAFLATAPAMAVAPLAEAKGPVAGVLSGDVPGTDPAVAAAVATELRAAGYEVVELNGEALCDEAQVSPDAFDLLVLPNAAQLPLRSVHTIDSYLKGGGDCIALNAPLWQERLIRVDGCWSTPEAYRREHAEDVPKHVVLNFAEGTVADWQRSAFRPEVKTVFETVGEGPGPGQRALHVTIPQLDNWDTMGPPLLENPFPEGHTVTAFSAKGGPNTTQLAVEWVEKDGSRWIGVIPLSQEWQHYVMAPADFRFWQSVPARANDTFRPENAVRMMVGLAFTHTGHSAGRQEFWVGPFGTAPMDSAYEDLVREAPSPKLDTLAPSYKFFNSSDVAELVAAPGQLLESATRFAVPQAIRSPHPRPQAGGFDKGRAYRWMPLLEARTAYGQWRGTPATLLCHADGPYRGGVWAGFGIGDGDWYLTRGALEAVRQVAQRMADGVFLIDGGSDFYTYFDGQEMVLGVRVANLNKARQTGLTARITVLERDSGRPAHRTRDFALDLEPGQLVAVSETWKLGDWPEEGFTVLAELLRDGKVIDRASHQAHVWRPKEEKDFITVENGEFMRNEERWRPHGVNYMPSSGIGSENWHDFEHWVGAGGYDPVVIQRDLEHVKDLGFNAVSIFIYRVSLEAQNLLDLLRRLEKLGLKANLSLRPGTPMDFRWQEMRELIEYYRLWEHDTVFALDLAWEPLFGKQARGPWDDAWEAWILERYGSFENAERDWEYPVPRDEDGNVVNVSPQQIAGDGRWNKMVAAYRRFLDTLLYDKYSTARRLVRSVDPNHLVSFRMSMAGDPTWRPRDCIAYDFAYLAGAVDVLEPEGYGRIGDWDRVKPGWFTHEYARWANPELPIMWAEAGLHAWDMGRMQSTPERLEAQAAFYQRFYRMLISSGADGIFFWWYPGGFRTGEKSDYGIINPDGSDRPVSKVIRRYGELFVRGPAAKPADTWIEIDRDRHVDGLAGIYDEVKEAFWDAIDSARVPGLKTAGTATDSSNCPLLAVGNAPCDGNNPPKYLDGFFDVVEVRGADGAWVAVHSGDEVAVNGTAPVSARVTLTNLGEATWIAQEESKQAFGAVCVVAEGDEMVRTPLPRPVARFETVQFEIRLAASPITGPTEVTLTLDAADRTRFGPKFRLRLVVGRGMGQADSSA